jgi:CDP-diacylglycerol--serine O-phosphatidyltransferase
MPYSRFDPERYQRRLQRLRQIPVRVLVPNVITLLALCAGLSGIRLAIEGRLELALGAIVFAAMLDAIDGRVARMIKGTSRFGAELDSLADFVNFGVAPGLILYFWGLKPLGNLGWIAAMVFAICGGLRLARFNVQIEDPNRPAWAGNFFTGMPAPAGAITVLLPIYLFFLNVTIPALAGHAGLCAGDRRADDLAPAGSVGQEDGYARAARNGAAGGRDGGAPDRVADQLSVAGAHRGHHRLSRLPAARLVLLSPP